MAVVIGSVGNILQRDQQQQRGVLLVNELAIANNTLQCIKQDDQCIPDRRYAMERYMQYTNCTHTGHVTTHQWASKVMISPFCLAPC